MCRLHYQRTQQGVELSKPVQRLRPKGSGTYLQGYLYLTRPDHPNANAKGSIGEHRLIMSETLGRPLLPGENVHHRNGNRADNRLTVGHELHCPNGPECCNLELWRKAQAIGQRAHDLVLWAESILETYAPEKLKAGSGIETTPCPA